MRSPFRTGLTAASAALALALPAATLAATTAAAAPEAPDRPLLAGVDCEGWVHNNDPLTGGVDCTNNTGGNVAIRVELTCSWAPDVTGDWVVVPPGQVGESRANCAFWAQGIDHVGWDVEPR
ncbi:hypothetical protein [Kitasatospora sp. LaBMicrA B282]|uniref:hypothetical protein n=1 Tax=Kitasatospora sp. LaBMicrA B282 TaxID=3420949 RepID=UPI003D14ABD4